jgi:hypothetical protein
MSLLKFFVQRLEKPVICESSIEDLVLQIRCIPPVFSLPNFLPVSSRHVTSQNFFDVNFYKITLILMCLSFTNHHQFH